jgi:uncharacterized protein YggT (Ycf19 family)
MSLCIGSLGRIDYYKVSIYKQKFFEVKMISTILSLLSAVISIYTILCLINIFLSWVPGLRFTSFGRFIYSVTEPYMGLFSRLSFLKFGNIFTISFILSFPNIYNTTYTFIYT